MRKFAALFLCFFCLNSLQAKSDVAVVTVAIGKNYRKTVAPILANKRAYCKKHGYDFFCLQDSLDTSRPPAWSKILLIKHLLFEKHYKWVFWSDADAMFMNMNIRLEDFLDTRYDFILTRDLNDINTGNFFIKNSPWSLSFLKRIYAKNRVFHRLGRYEQTAIIDLYETDPNVKMKTKIIPQRLINSYPAIWANRQFSDEINAIVNYHPGDFILHFAGAYKGSLRDRIAKALPLVLGNRELPSLDNHLESFGYRISPKDNQNDPNPMKRNEGYMDNNQTKTFYQATSSYLDINSILEIGFNAGHSAEFFLTRFPQAHVSTIDINRHLYTPIGVSYFEKYFPHQLRFLEGNSIDILPKLLDENKKYDLIFIDGDHSYEGALTDIINASKLAHKKTYIWIDDYHARNVRRAVDEAVAKNIILIENIYSFTKFGRTSRWVEARANLPE